MVALQTIPSVQQWTPNGASFMLSATSSLLVASDAGSPVWQIAQDFACELLELGATPTLLEVRRCQEPASGDIVFTLTSTQTTLGDEGYLLAIGEVAMLSAPSKAGIFYGTRTLLQLLCSGKSIDGGEIQDWPTYPERGLMIDIARRHFNAAWLMSQLRELAFLKMNRLHLHISDDKGFAIESSVLGMPAVEGTRLSQCDVHQILKLAERLNVEVVPEIDMPGHMGAILERHPQFGLLGHGGGRSCNILAIDDTAAVLFAQKLVAEFIGLFPGRSWHLGADEVMPDRELHNYPALISYARKHRGAFANEKDALLLFVNQMKDFLAGHGKITRVWGDDIGGGNTVALDVAVDVEWWTNISFLSEIPTIAPAQLMLQGHRVMNCGWWPTYYVPGRLLPPPLPDMRAAFEKWEVYEFYGFGYLDSRLHWPPERTPENDPKNLGAKLNAWNDNSGYESENELSANISERLRVIAQKTWMHSQSTSYDAFKAVSKAIGSAPYRKV